MRISGKDLIAAMALVTAMASLAPAAEIEGVRFAERVEAGERTLRLHGVGLLRWKVFFKGYVAALYLPDGVPGQSVLDDVSKRLELEYFWGISGEDFGPAGEEILRQNVDTETIRSLRDRLDRIDRMYPDVEPGDRLSLTYVPGEGTTLAKNGEPIGTIEGADFAAAYYTIWLGENPIDASLRDRLLTGT